MRTRPHSTPKPGTSASKPSGGRNGSFGGSPKTGSKTPTSTRTSGTPRYRRRISEAQSSPTDARSESIRALQNLEFARKLLPEWIPRPAPAGLLDSFFFWHRTLSSAERSIAAAVSFAAAALLAAAGIRFGQPVLRNLAIVPGLLWLALLASLVLDPSTRAKDEAVIIADEVVARSADSAIAPSPFPGPLPGGVEVRILEERSPWVRVRLANGRDAWVSGSALSKVDVNG
jgi:hypothetical protein